MNEEGKEDPSIEGSSSEPMSKYKWEGQIGRYHNISQLCFILN
jgi:hypothetical protein